MFKYRSHIGVGRKLYRYKSVSLDLSRLFLTAHYFSANSSFGGALAVPLWGQAVYPLWWPSLTKDMQTEQLLCWEWYDRHRA